MSPDEADAGPDYWTTCSGNECNEEVGRDEALTVEWANVSFCSRECRDRWTSAMSSGGGLNL